MGPWGEVAGSHWIDLRGRCPSLDAIASGSGQVRAYVRSSSSLFGGQPVKREKRQSERKKEREGEREEREDKAERREMRARGHRPHGLTAVQGSSVAGCAAALRPTPGEEEAEWGGGGEKGKGAEQNTGRCAAQRCRWCSI